MLISLDWIRDYVPLPADLNPRDLAERLTRTTAEVEGVTPIAIAACGLIAARIASVADLPDTKGLRLVVVDIGDGKTAETVSAAPLLPEGALVLYAPPGASVAALGELGTATIGGRQSAGMILPGHAVGIDMAVREAVLLSDEFKPGDAIAPETFNDWIIEIDNKSLTHRPDLWGHYGIAREIAAIVGVELKPYPVVPIEELTGAPLPAVAIAIEGTGACRRYTGLMLAGVPTQPAPLWMQLRLGRTGMRPISGLVDLTNYVMADLGQPMHAFDAAKVSQIEVDFAAAGDAFTTLDGMKRKLDARDLMIKCQGSDIALGGVMGGSESEVTEGTKTLLLESANFDPATIRRTAGRLGLRTDASARFEKSLDPEHTVLSVRRFMQLARAMYPDMKLMSRLSDCYPKPKQAVTVCVNPKHVARTIGREVSLSEATGILAPLGFSITQARSTQADDHWTVAVPTYRATNDISIEADVIEELARYIGFDSLAPTLPRVATRQFPMNALHELEQRTLDHFTSAHGFAEIHGYLWYDGAWLDKIGVDPGRCIELRNPAAEGLHRFRKSLLPGMLAAAARNRHHFDAFSLIELGSVFARDDAGDREHRHVGFVCARRGKKHEESLYQGLKGAIETWAWRRFACPVHFSKAPARAGLPWEHPERTAAITISNVGAGTMDAVGADTVAAGSMDTVTAGTISVIGVPLKRAMDDHLAAWSLVWAELRLDDLVGCGRPHEQLGRIREHPLVALDFSIVVEAAVSYAEVANRLASFDDTLLRQLRYVTSFTGGSLDVGKRSLTFRVLIGDDQRTLTDADVAPFRSAFESFVKESGYGMRG